MDLSFPLVAVSPTLDAGVLQVLASTTSGCTAAELHRRLGRGSDEGVRKVLGRLVRQGVVVSDRSTRYSVYSLNRDHVAAPYIEALARVRVEIIQRIGAEIDGWQISPLHAGLFGSFARGRADSDSDIDVLLVRPSLDGRGRQDTEERWMEQIDRLGRRIRSWTGNHAQIIDLTHTTLQQMDRDGDPLVESWRADGIPVHGGRLVDVLRGSR